MTLLSKFIVYRYNDMSAFFINGLSKHLGSGLFYGYENSRFIDKFSGDVIIVRLTKILWHFFDPITTNNLLVLLAMLLSFYFSYKLFSYISIKYYEKNFFSLSVAFSLIYCFSPYFVFRVISATPSLYFTFVFPLFFYLILKKTKYYWLSLVNILVFLVSSYYGYFVFLTFLFWMTSAALYQIFFERKFNYRVYFKKNLTYLTPLILIMLILYGKVIITNLSFSPLYKPYDKEQRENTTTFYRPIENFYNFSLRPWYFLIPPKTSLFFGRLSSNIYKDIRNTNYFLANDYQEEEMGGSYLGWHFLVGLLVIFYLLAFKKKYLTNLSGEDQKIYKTLMKLSITLLLVFLFTEPPSFTIHGITIFTPSFLLYKFIPAFRVLSRFSVVIFLLLCLLNFILFRQIIIKLHFEKVMTVNLLSLLLLIVSFVVFSLQLPIINLSKPPAEYAYLGEIKNKPAVFMILPKAQYKDTFWLLYHKNYLYNPKGLFNPDTNFDADEFTKQLANNPKNISEMLDLGINYILVDTSDKNPELGGILNYLSNSNASLVFKTSDTLIYKINN